MLRLVDPESLDRPVPAEGSLRGAAKVALSRRQRNPKTMASMMSHLDMPWHFSRLLIGASSGGPVFNEQSRILQIVLRRVTVEGECAATVLGEYYKKSGKSDLVMYFIDPETSVFTVDFKIPYFS